ncbi:MAG: hypothetical protein MRECE_58c002 [Mycoplasmataceae bacterium CE_OT135]|nr:MAG: hypothetical protein MRECE_58c002 [Mycoplasmataceae bacterium CE_OT135]
MNFKKKGRGSQNFGKSFVRFRRKIQDFGSSSPRQHHDHCLTFDLGKNINFHFFELCLFELLNLTILVIFEYHEEK